MPSLSNEPLPRLLGTQFSHPRMEILFKSTGDTHTFAKMLQMPGDKLRATCVQPDCGWEVIIHCLRVEGVGCSDELIDRTEVLV